MRIAITGSRGFIGGSFARHAAAAGHEVLGISRSTQPERDWPGEHLHADGLHSDLSVKFREWHPDAVLHAAGSASVGESLAEPLADMRALAMTLANTIDGIRRAGIAPVLLVPSSAAVYGNPASLPVPETGAIAPISPYGFHKAACELLGREAAEILGLRVVVCRFFSVYGPRQRRLLIWEVYRQLAGEAPMIELQGTGSETRDFLHVEDACAALLALAQHAKRGAAVVNVATGTETSVAQLVEEMKRVCDKEKMLVRPEAAEMIVQDEK
jgi:UDP-glucose 4-epimerase